MADGPRARRRWSSLALLREALKNVLTLGGRSLVLLGCAVLGASATVAFEAHRSVSFVDELEELRLSGRNLVTLASADPSASTFAIQRASCEALDDSPGVDRAGGLMRSESVDTEQLGPRVPVVALSPHLLPDDGSVLVGAALSDVSGSFVLSVEGVPVRAVRGVNEPEQTQLNTSLAVPLEPSVRWVPVCVVELGRFQRSADLVGTLASQVVTRGGGLAAVEGFTTPIDPVRAFEADSSRFLPALVALFCAVLAAIQGWATVSEAAAYRLSGTTAGQHAVLRGLEQVVLAGIFVASGALAVLALQTWLVAPTATLLRVIQGGAVWCVVHAVVTAPMLRADPTSLAKDR